MSDDILPAGKTCNTCLEWKPYTDFHVNKNCKDGYLSKCKVCRKTSDTEYVANHRENSRESARRWRANNTEKSDQRARKWALEHPLEIKKIQDKHRHSEQGKLSQRRYLKTRDPEKRATAVRKYYLANMDAYRNRCRNRRARVHGSTGSHTKEEVTAIALAQDMKCVYCRVDLADGYHVDHIMPIALGGSNDKSNIQALCPTCNLKKGAKHPEQYARQLIALINPETQAS